MEFYKQLSVYEKKVLRRYLVEEAFGIEDLQEISSIPQKIMNQIFAVRGLVAYGIIEHCLTLRNGVDYGVPGPSNLKRVGVPY